MYLSMQVLVLDLNRNDAHYESRLLSKIIDAVRIYYNREDQMKVTKEEEKDEDKSEDKVVLVDNYGDLFLQSYFTLVTFKHLFFTLNYHHWQKFSIVILQLHTQTQNFAVWIIPPDNNMVSSR